MNQNWKIKRTLNLKKYILTDRQTDPQNQQYSIPYFFFHLTSILPELGYKISVSFATLSPSVRTFHKKHSLQKIRSKQYTNTNTKYGKGFIKRPNFQLTSKNMEAGTLYKALHLSDSCWVLLIKKYNMWSLEWFWEPVNYIGDVPITIS